MVIRSRRRIGLIHSTGAARAARRRRGGFTFVELVIVMLVIGIMTAVAAPKFADSLLQHRATAAAQRGAMDLRFARRNAMAISGDQYVSYDANANSYQIFPGVTHLDHPSQTYTVELDESPYTATIVSVSFNGGSQVTFNGYGLPDNAGTIVVQAGSHQKTILLDVNTGEATVQ